MAAQLHERQRGEIDNMAAEVQKLRRRIWHTLSSIKTGVILLILVVIVSALGTIILQRPVTEADELQRAYSPQMLRIFDALGLTDVFHAWWFVALLILVSFSIVAASIERFPNAWRFYARPYKYPEEGFRKSLPAQALIAVPGESAGLMSAERALESIGFKSERVQRNDHVSLFAERNRISEMAVYIVHASLLLIFLGGIIDAVWGWRGFMSLNQGQQSSQIELHNGTHRTLPFAIRCDSAGQERYQDGTPKKWWSKLTVVDGGRDLQNKEIVVNDPLVYRGVRFYQASFGSTGKVAEFLVTASPLAAGNAQELSLKPNVPVALDSDTSVELAEFIPDYVVRDGQVYTRSTDIENPAAHLVVSSKASGKRVNYWIPAIDGVAENTGSPYRFDPKDLKMGYFTGLEVSHEPGQWGVWTGVVLMGIGLTFVFYVSHVRFWVFPVADRDGKLSLWVGGTSNRNRDAFEAHFKDLTEKIADEVKAQRQARKTAVQRETEELEELASK
jgi:cytochrome c biogenesis protein